MKPEKSPVWSQVVEQIKREILAEGHPEGERFPSLSELCTRFSISKITALRAVSELEKAGLLRRIPRKGTFLVGCSSAVEIKVLLPLQDEWPSHALPLLWSYLRGIEAACSKAHCRMGMLSLEHIRAHPDPGARYIVITRGLGDPVCRLLNEQGLRNVCLHSPALVSGNDCVRSDLYGGGSLMTSYLLQKGHRRIAFACGSLKTPWYLPRLKGYMAAMEEAGEAFQPKYIAEIASSTPQPAEVAGEIDRLLSLPEPPTAIVASDDLRALAVWGYLESKGISIPRDLSLTGMDARLEARGHCPPLTSCDWRMERQGEMAVERLLEEKPSGRATDQCVPPQLTEGDSVRELAAD